MSDVEYVLVLPHDAPDPDDVPVGVVARWLVLASTVPVGVLLGLLWAGGAA